MILAESLIVPPLFLRRWFSETVWETNDGSVLYTFDDGPYIQSTHLILRWLEEHNIHALFFVNGRGDRGAMKEISQSGHTLGNHLFDHKRAMFMSRDEIEAALLKTNRIIEDISGQKCKYFRPPYGVPFIGMSSMMKRTGMKTVMWSLLSWDFREDIEKVNAILSRYISTGKIVVFHNNPRTEAKIISVLDYSYTLLAERGLICGEPDKCLK